MRRGTALAWVTMGVLWGSPLAVDAQRPELFESERPAGHFGIHFIAAEARGDLAYFFEQGFGAQFEGSLPMDESGHLRLRGDLGFLVYGHERQSYCFSVPIGCRIGVDLTTTNNIFFGGVGPEVVLHTGALEPYLHATLGFSYFATTSSLSGEDGYGESHFSTTHLSDGLFAWKFGGGVRIEVKGGRKPVSLDFGVERHENGVAEFLTKGDILDHDDGSITLFPNRSEADLLTFRFGVSFGIPRGGDRN